MEKKIEEYLPLYLMCEVMATYDGMPRRGYLTGVTNNANECEIQFFTEDGINVFEEPEICVTDEVKPFLRKLPSMTEEEKVQLKLNVAQEAMLGDMYIMWTFEQVRLLLLMKFDLFGLTEAGLAFVKENEKP